MGDDGMVNDGGRELSDAEWDALADRELDALAAASEAVPLRAPPVPRERPFRWPAPARVIDRRLAVLEPGGVGEFLRACRAAAGLSQRQLAEAAGVGQTAVARLESGAVEDVRVSTLARLANACDVMLVGTTAGYVVGTQVPLLESDRAQRHRDGADRLLPAHLLNRPRQRPEESAFPSHLDRPYTPRRYCRTPIKDVVGD